MNEKPLYVQWSIRDYSLPIVEIWCQAETTDPRQWTEKMQPKSPYIFFVQHDGLVYDYTDETGIEWIKGELLELVRKDAAYPRWLVGEFSKRTDRLKPIWESKQMLDREALVDYLKNLRDIWAWFDGVWWLMEFAEPSSEASRLAGDARKSTEQMVPSSDLLIKRSLLKIYPELGESAYLLQFSEIEKDAPPSRSELEKRKHLYSYANATLFTGEDEHDMQQRFSVRIEKAPELSIELRTLKGQPACGGIARGRVRKILDRAGVEAMQKGEILVASMTIPGFLPAMQKAAAIVTDEGGIASHVSIIARELKKPCLMGTKFATKIFNDGDMIEVDANNGIVRKMNAYEH